MASVILQVPRDGAVHRALREAPPRSVADGTLTVQALPADADGRLDPPDAGQIVLSVPSPETLGREPEDVRRVIAGAGDANGPIVVVVEVAEYLREEELRAVLGAAERAERPVIVRVLGDP
jgi:prolyl-tRNA editing enzyme YbaK/EbsC (Cys-tRNA(Pro) deacylase)